MILKWLSCDSNEMTLDCTILKWPFQDSDKMMDCIVLRSSFWDGNEWHLDCIWSSYFDKVIIWPLDYYYEKVILKW